MPRPIRRAALSQILRSSHLKLNFCAKCPILRASVSAARNSARAESQNPRSPNIHCLFRCFTIQISTFSVLLKSRVFTDLQTDRLTCLLLTWSQTHDITDLLYSYSSSFAGLTSLALSLLNLSIREPRLNINFRSITALFVVCFSVEMLCLTLAVSSNQSRHKRSSDMAGTGKL
jgi:hypothetical protein